MKFYYVEDVGFSCSSWSWIAKSKELLASFLNFSKKCFFLFTGTFRFLEICFGGSSVTAGIGGGGRGSVWAKEDSDARGTVDVNREKGYFAFGSVMETSSV